MVCNGHESVELRLALRLQVYFGIFWYYKIYFNATVINGVTQSMYKSGNVSLYNFAVGVLCSRCIMLSTAGIKMVSMSKSVAFRQ